MFEFDRRLYIVDFEILLDGANLYNYDCVWEPPHTVPSGAQHF